MTHTIERRSAELEVRAKGRKLEGYAAVFSTRAKIADFDEIIAPGAFAATLATRKDVLALVDHDARALLGRTRNDSLKLSEDSKGLHFEIALPQTTLADDILALAEVRSIGGASFGFTATKDAWQGTLRTLHAVDLREISIVQSWPAYPQTSVSARALGHCASSPLARRLRLLELEAGQ
ncbi:MAG: HK97 family phage prohead protease [Hyphomonadaceae bacterium]